MFKIENERKDYLVKKLGDAVCLLEKPTEEYLLEEVVDITTGYEVERWMVLKERYLQG